MGMEQHRMAKRFATFAAMQDERVCVQKDMQL
eukprot:CAMPEP_0115363190 /NCGR_PEP_ID=MMETSP0270-20121206/103099_1 /TAXON_ID=71861 /ORGANISM="Scrippsiella trochoidea, Strain CCMP3099" /LENGTH=31 /DNA_ID= /DNA_START= /DNA_END= /DNA_ORIENTATION=